MAINNVILDIPIESIPFHFEQAKLAFAAIGSVAVGAIFQWDEIRKSRHLESSVPESLQVADEESAALQMRGMNRARTSKRLGFGAAVAVAAFGLAHAAGPYTERDERVGTATLLVDASYAANVADMDEGDNMRIEAGINGSLLAAHKNEIPVSFIAVGSRALPFDQQPASGKELVDTGERFRATLAPTFRNGYAIGDAVEQADSLGRKNAIVVVGSRAGDAQENQRIAAISNRLQTEERGEVFAVLMGDGQGTYSVGSQELTAGVDTETYQTMLGRDNVATATSTDEVVEAIDAFVDQTTVRSERTSSNFYLKGAIASGLLLAAQAAKRWTSDRLALRRINMNQAEEK